MADNNDARLEQHPPDQGYRDHLDHDQNQINL